MGRSHLGGTALVFWERLDVVFKGWVSGVSIPVDCGRPCRKSRTIHQPRQILRDIDQLEAYSNEGKMWSVNRFSDHIPGVDFRAASITASFSTGFIEQVE